MTHESIVRRAKDSGADDTLLDALNTLPDQPYEKPTDISTAIYF